MCNDLEVAHLGLEENQTDAEAALEWLEQEFLNSSWGQAFAAASSSGDNVEEATHAASSSGDNVEEATHATSSSGDNVEEATHEDQLCRTL